MHRDAGVDIQTNVTVTGFSGTGQVEQVLCADGSRLDADSVLIGVGVVPNVELASDAGLAVDDGIVVDEYTRSSDPDIVAIGDCSNHPSKRYGGRRLRLESVPNALAQARTAAATLCGGQKPYTEPPWFWSDQYQLKLQIVGIKDGHDNLVTRGEINDGGPDATPKFMLCYLQNGELLAAESVNNPREFMACRQLVASREELDESRAHSLWLLVLQPVRCALEP